ncbi:MAG: hypothetical protein IJC81_04280 [Clostridia bacterium]|nr:hypothetical protein [Clostridia bacterium]
MKVAIIGSRKIKHSDFENYLPQGITEIIWSGENEILRKYAKDKRIKLTLFPLDNGYGRAAKFMRAMDAILLVDAVIAFWDGEDMYTKAMIGYCKNTNKNVILIMT